MNMRNNFVIAGTAAACLVSGPAFAAGTTTGSSINNTAWVGFSVAGVAQTAVSSNGVCNADGMAGGTYTPGTTTVSGTLSDVAADAVGTLYFRATVN